MKFVIAFIVVLVSPNDSLQSGLVEFNQYFSSSNECEVFLKEYTKEKIYLDYKDQWKDVSDSLPNLILEPSCFEKDIENDFIPMLRDFYNISDFLNNDPI